MAILGVEIEERVEVKALGASGVHEITPITIMSGSGVMTRGQVVGLNITSFKWGPLDFAASDGTETARCILAEDVDATDADVKTHGHAVGTYHLPDLVWPAGATDAQKNAALLQFRDRGILVDKDFIL